jgi:transcriptional regulator with XRE-family HTH domain
LDLYQALGAHIRHHRRGQDITQEALAARVNLPVEIIGKIERGTTASSFDTVEKIATALLLPPLALFGVGEEAIPSGERGRLLGLITTILAGMNEEQMARAAKMLEIFKGP